MFRLYIYFRNQIYMDIPYKFKIVDERSPKDFKDKTICEYLRKDVLSIFQKCLMVGKIEESCNWAMELLCCGHVDKVYDKLYVIIVKNINVNYKELINIFSNRYSTFLRFKKVLNGDILRMRNFQNIRNHIAELCTLVCLSTKTKGQSSIKITDDHFNMEFVKSKFRADKCSYIDPYSRFGDPEEVKIILNEFIFHLLNHNYDYAVYWLYWIMEWEKINIKKKKEFKCGYRSVNNVEKNCHTNIVWLLWEILLNLEKNEYIDSLFALYTLNFKITQRTKKFPLILFAIKIYTDSHKIVNQNIYEKNLETIIQVCGNINKLFVDKKKREINNVKKQQEEIHESNYNKYNNIVKEELDKRKNKNKDYEKSVKKMTTLEELDNLFLSKST